MLTSYHLFEQDYVQTKFNSNIVQLAWNLGTYLHM
jgi:hypothetical protein